MFLFVIIFLNCKERFLLNLTEHQTWHLTPEQLLFLLLLAPASLASLASPASSSSRLSMTVGSEVALTVVRVVELLTSELLA